MLNQLDAEFLRQVPIFGALPPAGLAHMTALARRVDYDGRAQVCAEDEPARELYVVVKGAIEVRKRGRSGVETRIAVLRQGDVAGEMAVIDIQPRSASMSCLGPASLIVLSVPDLASLHEEHPEAYLLLVMNIAREISRRLRRFDALLADIVTDVQEAWTSSMSVPTAPAGGAR